MKDITKNKMNGYDFLAIISGIGLICWLVAGFFGNMILTLVYGGIILVPLLLLYFFSFFETIISLIRNRNGTSKVKVIVHSAVIVTIISFVLYDSEIFKSKAIMTAVLRDDLFHYKLVFRENGNVENRVNGFLGYSRTYHGKYHIEGSLIIFSELPYDNGFIPDTLFLDREQNAIFISSPEGQEVQMTKQWLNHFEIQ